MSDARLIFAVLAIVLVGACGGQAEVETPAPAVPSGPTAEELAAQARRDSLAAVAREEAEARRQREAIEREAAAMRRSLTQTVYFDYDEAVIRTDAEEALREKVDIMRANAAVELRLEGHADERGTSEYNIALGNQRADAVIRYMTGFGLEARRFSSVSYGEERPRARGSNEASWAQNRRVEFVITAGGADDG